MAHDFSLADSDEVKAFDFGVKRPDGLNYVDFVLLVMTVASEGRTNSLKNR